MAIIGISFICPAQNHQLPLKIVTEIAPPLQFFNGKKLEGKTTSLVRQSVKLSGLEAKFEVYPWARSYQTVLSSPNTLIYPLIKTPSREKQFIWIGKLLSFKLEIISLQSRGFAALSTLEQAKQLKIGVVRDDYVHQYLVEQGFMQHQNFQLSSELGQTLQLLYAGKIDAVIADLPLLKVMAQSKDLDANQLHAIFALPKQRVDLFLAANKDMPSSIINRLKSGLAQSKALNK